jgi:peptide deformylase
MLIESMIATMRRAKGIGLAAPQVGINRRLFVIDIGHGPMAMVNPRITRASGSGVLEEGCLSIPEVTVLVERPQTITVEYTDEHNEMVELTCEELLARVVQHELDHLDGKLIVDYASASEKDKFKEILKALEAEAA